jgi:hypothetical protein
MKVKDLIKELKKFNKDAEVSVIVHCKEEKFSFSWVNGGDDDSSTTRDIKREKLTACSVSLYVDSLCGNDRQSE